MHLFATIETVMEVHGGAYRGRHARYGLACDVRDRLPGYGAR